MIAYGLSITVFEEHIRLIRRRRAGTEALMDAFTRLVNLASEEGYLVVELLAPPRWLQIGREDVERFRELCSSKGLEVRVHQYPSDNIASPSEYAWRSNLNSLLRSLEVASSMGASCFIVHPGFYRRITGSEAARSRARAALYELVDKAQELGIRLLVENNSRGSSIYISPDEMLDLVREFNVRIVFDPAHAYRSGFNPLEFYRDLRDHIDEVHVNDALDNREHLPVGEGMIDYSSLIKEIGPEPKHVFVIETCDIKGAKASREYLERELEKLRSRATSEPLNQID
ncbi:MAG: hypothetical protein DRN15_01805 [Thermoprotei archaeon]|nr:MAG: hypothetical protein DRM97_07635 [Thermoprotei archaeon]RLF24699.1 MAG: hypothetical protein DRN15_01805 [Thermoprotei archaeon]